MRRFVLKSTSAVYGASSRDPAVFTEKMQARQVPSGGFAKDSVDIEGYVRSFARRRPDVDVVVLRFTNFIGPRIDSLLTGFFRMPVVPTALGYDARVQLLHEDDALAVLVRATTGDFVGTVNVGGEGTLLLSQAIRRLGRIEVPLPTPALGSVGRISRRFGFVDYSPEQMRFLNFGRVVDTTVLRTEFGFVPRYTTAEALADYARTVPPVVPPRLVGTTSTRLRAVLGRAGDAAAALGERLNPAPPAPGSAGGAGCLRPASSRCGPTTTSPSSPPTPPPGWEEQLADAAGVPPPPGHRRVRDRRVRLRPRPDRPRPAADPAAVLREVVPGRRPGPGERADAPAAGWWWPTTPARSRSTR